LNNKGFEYLTYTNLSSVKFYYIDDSDEKKEWVRETHFSDCDDVYIDVVDKSEVTYYNEFPYYFKLSTARKSITAYILFNEFSRKAEKQGCYLKLCPSSGNINISKLGKRYSYPFRNISKLATQEYSSLISKLDAGLKLLNKGDLI